MGRGVRGRGKGGEGKGMTKKRERNEKKKKGNSFCKREGDQELKGVGREGRDRGQKKNEDVLCTCTNSPQ